MSLAICRCQFTLGAKTGSRGEKACSFAHTGVGQSERQSQQIQQQSWEPEVKGEVWPIVSIDTGCGPKTMSTSVRKQATPAREPV